jgi:hypothetical protein
VSKINVKIYPKSARPALHDLNKHPQQRVMQLREIARPRYVTQTNGVRVKYEGP